MHAHRQMHTLKPCLQFQYGKNAFFARFFIHSAHRSMFAEASLKRAVWPERKCNKTLKRYPIRQPTFFAFLPVTTKGAFRKYPQRRPEKSVQPAVLPFLQQIPPATAGTETKRVSCISTPLCAVLHLMHERKSPPDQRKTHKKAQGVSRQ